MPVCKLTIKGIGYHDFAGRLDELYQFAIGRRVSLSIEHENEAEQDAVIAYLGNEFLGYVRSGDDRKTALSLFRQSSRGMLFAYVSAVDRDNRAIIVDVNNNDNFMPADETVCDVLSNWHYDGPLLRQDEAEVRLRTMFSSLEMLVESGEPWDDDMEAYLGYVEQNIWRDISLERYEQMLRLLKILTAQSNSCSGYAVAAKRLQRAIDSIGNPATRQRQVAHIVGLAKSVEADRLLKTCADSASEAVMQLPAVLGDLFLSDPELLMGRLWYHHQPSVKVRAVITLLAMMMRQSVSVISEMEERMQSDGEAYCLAPADTSSTYYIANGRKTDIVKVLWALLKTDPLRRHDGKSVCIEDAVNYLLSHLGEAKSTRVGQTMNSAKNTDTFLTIFNDLSTLAQKYYLK